MSVHVMCTQCVVAWLQFIDVWDFVIMYLLAAQGALPPSTRPRILLDVLTEDQPSYQPAGQGPEPGRLKNGEFGPPFWRQGEGVVICPPFREGYPNHAQATTFGLWRYLPPIILYGRSNLLEIKNCKVIPGDHVAPQLRLVVIDLNVRNPRGGNKNYENKIGWTGLRNPEKRHEFKTKVLNRITTTEERVHDWWENNASVLRNVARDVLGETTGKPRTERKEWWWKDEIQLVLKEKKELKKQWEQTRLQADKVEYKRKKKEAKRAVAVARAEAASGLYEELEMVQLRAEEDL